MPVERGGGPIRPSKYPLIPPSRRWLILAVVVMMVLAPTQRMKDASATVPSFVQDEAETDTKLLNITFDSDDGYGLPDEIDPGWYIVTLTNSSEVDVAADIVQLPPDREVEELQRSITTDSGKSTVPDWFEQVTFAGGPWAKAGEEGQTLIQLTTGNWHVLQVGNAESPVVELQVSDQSAPVDLPKMDQRVEVSFAPGALTMPDEVTTGNIIWRVTNSDTLTHAFALVLLPAEMSYDEMLTMLETGTVPEDVILDEAPVVGGIGLLSGGRTIWTVYDLNPGYYVALDYVPIKDGRTFAELGQFAMFIVAAPKN